MCLCFPRRRGAKRQQQQVATAEAPKPVQWKPPSPPVVTTPRIQEKKAKPYVSRTQPFIMIDHIIPLETARNKLDAERIKLFEERKKLEAERKKLDEERKNLSGGGTPVQSTTGTGGGAVNTQNQNMANTMNVQVQQQIAAGEGAAYTPERKSEDREHKTQEQEHKAHEGEQNHYEQEHNPALIERKGTPPVRNHETGFTKPWEKAGFHTAKAERTARASQREHSDTYTSSEYTSRPRSSGGGGYSYGGGGGYDSGGGGGYDSGGGGGGGGFDSCGGSSSNW